MKISSLSALLLLLLQQPCAGVKETEGTKFGADVSFPIHYLEFATENSDPGLAHRKAFWEEFMEGCRETYGAKGHQCDRNEQDRVDMSLRQTQSMVNYTDTGFKKIRAPQALRDLLFSHWETNKDRMYDNEEKWPAGNVYVNHWSSPTYMLSTEDDSLVGGGDRLKNMIWDAAQETIEQWTGMEQKPISQYGIRVYTEGAVLSPHVDRLPLVSSCIVNIAQDLDEDWPLEVYDREGNAVNVTMKPGDMVLYESHSLIHGRPFPLKGKYFANIFIHFEPTGRTLAQRDGLEDFNEEDLDMDFPPYIQKGSPEDAHWRSQNPGGWKGPAPAAAQGYTPEGHMAAQQGDVELLERIAKENKRLLSMKDRNGWQPIHEAARGGHKDAVELLIKHGVDKDVRTTNGDSPLFLALESHSQKHPVVQYLKSIEAKSFGPEL